MRTTIDLDEDILQTAKELAALRKTTMGKIVSEFARKGMAPSTEPTSIRNGVPLLPPREGARPVTLEAVRRLQEDEL